MMEPFFGSPGPMWAATAPPGFGWTGASIPAGTSSTGTTTPVPVAAAFSPFVTTETAAGPTAGAVVVAVAMRRGQPTGPNTDAEIEDFLYDAFELIPGTSEVEVRCEGGRVTLSGNVPNKRHKRDVGEIAWAIPSINDVHNNATITARRRSRASGRETETQSGAVRKHG
ncbi:MAG: BON domain-containing protein [Acidobacteriota bacterium]